MQLVDGEPVEDEDIQDAGGLVQQALIDINGGEDPFTRPAAPVVEPVADPAPVPAVAIRASVKPDYLVCLECGEKHNQLTRHLSSKHGLSKADYLARWKLPVDYPFIAPNYAEASPSTGGEDRAAYRRQAGRRQMNLQEHLQRRSPR